MPHLLRKIREAIQQLNPNEVREQAERRIRVRLTASSGAVYRAMEDFLIPSNVSHARRAELMNHLWRTSHWDTPEAPELDVYESGLLVPEEGFEFDPHRPQTLVHDVLARNQDLGLPLARCFPPFRRRVVDRIVFSISKENALFALMTALPDLAPGISLAWSVPEAASDATVLTINQIRMAFLLAAASRRPVGYREQKTEVASIIAGCFGWRALAREMVSKIPLGGGIIPKAAIAFAATYVEGVSLERWYRLGYGYSRDERKLAYVEALARGKRVVSVLWNNLKHNERVVPRQPLHRRGS